MSNDVTMTTGRLSVQPGFGVFRRAATQTIRVFNLLSGRKRATVPDGITGRWVVVGRGLAWVGDGYVAEDEVWRGTTKSGIIWTSQLEMKMKKVVGVISFFFLFSCDGLLPSQSSNWEQRHERDKQINTRRETPSHTHIYRIHRMTNRWGKLIRNSRHLWAHGHSMQIKESRERTIATAWGAWRITPATADCWRINRQTSWLRGSRRPSCFLIKALTKIFVRGPNMSAVSKSVVGLIPTLWSLNAKVSSSKILNVHDCPSKGWQAVPSVTSEVASVTCVWMRNSETVTFAINDQRSAGTHEEKKNVKSKSRQVKGIYFW